MSGPKVQDSTNSGSPAISAFCSLDGNSPNGVSPPPSSLSPVSLPGSDQRGAGMSRIFNFFWRGAAGIRSFFLYVATALRASRIGCYFFGELKPQLDLAQNREALSFYANRKLSLLTELVFDTKVRPDLEKMSDDPAFLLKIKDMAVAFSESFQQSVTPLLAQNQLAHLVEELGRRGNVFLQQFAQNRRLDESLPLQHRQFLEYQAFSQDAIIGLHPAQLPFSLYALEYVRGLKRFSSLLDSGTNHQKDLPEKQFCSFVSSGLFRLHDLKDAYALFKESRDFPPRESCGKLEMWRKDLSATAVDLYRLIEEEKDPSACLFARFYMGRAQLLDLSFRRCAINHSELTEENGETILLNFSKEKEFSSLIIGFQELLADEVEAAKRTWFEAYYGQIDFMDKLTPLLGDSLSGLSEATKSTLKAVVTFSLYEGVRSLKPELLNGILLESMKPNQKAEEGPLPGSVDVEEHLSDPAAIELVSSALKSMIALKQEKNSAYLSLQLIGVLVKGGVLTQPIVDVFDRWLSQLKDPLFLLNSLDRMQNEMWGWDGGKGRYVVREQKPRLDAIQSRDAAQQVKEKFPQFLKGQIPWFFFQTRSVVEETGESLVSVVESPLFLSLLFGGLDAVLQTYAFEAPRHSAGAVKARYQKLLSDQKERRDRVAVVGTAQSPQRELQDMALLANHLFVSSDLSKITPDLTASRLVQEFIETGVARVEEAAQQVDLHQFFNQIGGFLCDCIATAIETPSQVGHFALLTEEEKSNLVKSAQSAYHSTHIQENMDELNEWIEKSLLEQQQRKVQLYLEERWAEGFVNLLFPLDDQDLSLSSFERESLVKVVSRQLAEAMVRFFSPESMIQQIADLLSEEKSSSSSFVLPQLQDGHPLPSYSVLADRLVGSLLTALQIPEEQQAKFKPLFGLVNQDPAGFSSEMFSDSDEPLLDSVERFSDSDEPLMDSAEKLAEDATETVNLGWSFSSWFDTPKRAWRSLVSHPLLRHPLETILTASMTSKGAEALLLRQVAQVSSPDELFARVERAFYHPENQLRALREIRNAAWVKHEGEWRVKKSPHLTKQKREQCLLLITEKFINMARVLDNNIPFLALGEPLLGLQTAPALGKSYDHLITLIQNREFLLSTGLVLMEKLISALQEAARRDDFDLSAEEGGVRGDSADALAASFANRNLRIKEFAAGQDATHKKLHHDTAWLSRYRLLAAGVRKQGKDLGVVAQFHDHIQQYLTR